MMIRDLINGIKYKIPICCIFYFIKQSSFKYTINTAYEVDKSRGNTYIMKGDGYIPLHPDIPYVECDKCFKSSRPLNSSQY